MAVQVLSFWLRVVVGASEPMRRRRANRVRWGTKQPYAQDPGAVGPLASGDGAFCFQSQSGYSSMAYQVIARKWRPALFSDVVGQEHVVKTLRGEIMRDRTAHAYLFVGPRGVGKTTIARIFAKALNCEKYPSEEPCCKCDSCLAIAEGSHLDIIEIDGASNNSVGNVRQLREEALYTPIKGRFKIYIIDEAHMLSPDAWNALLKIIEEPPPHVKFFFATTESHKVPVTVVSRCQRFDLARIGLRQITGQLSKIADAEGVSISNAAIEALARAANGGMRDAQSLLDQMISFSAEGEIAEEHVLAMFGLAATSEVEEIVQAIIEDNRPEIVSVVNKFAMQGRNLEKLLDDVLAFLRGAHICAIMPDPGKVLDVGDDILEIYKRMAAAGGADMILKLLEFLSPIGGGLRNALNKQVYLETALLNAAHKARAVEISTLVERLNKLRRGGDFAVLEKVPAVSSDPPAETRKETPESPVGYSTPKNDEPTPSRVAESQSIADSSADATIPPPPPQPQQEQPPPTAKKLHLLEHPKNTTGAAEPLPSPTAIWHAMTKDMEHRGHTLLKAYMLEGRPVKFDGTELTVVYDEDSDSLNVTELCKQRLILEDCMKKASKCDGATVNIVSEKGVVSPREIASMNTRDMEDIRNKVEKNQFVQDVMSFFDAEIVDVRG